MKILIALDTEEYSKTIVRTAAQLVKNTLADVVLLGVQEQSANQPDQHLTDALQRYQQEIFASFTDDERPYADFSGIVWEKTGDSGWQAISKGMKEFSLFIRTGSAAKQIIAIAQEIESDLVLIGGAQPGCEWQGELSVPLRVAEDSPCSVLLIKQVTNIDKIVSILDQSVVSQESLEMVNQLVTLHGTGLKIVGVKEKKGSREGAIEKTMVDLMKYYNDRKINAWVKLLNGEDVESYVTNASREGVVALWMGGKQSFLKKLFSRTMVDKLLSNTKSSLLILR
jgi:nucleotide-binding universal stress UspA family protein